MVKSLISVIKWETEALNFNLKQYSVTINSIQITIAGEYIRPWFSGKELCMALGYKDTQKALFEHLRPKQKTTLAELQKVGPPVGPTFLWPFSDELSYDEEEAVYVSEYGAYGRVSFLLVIVSKCG